MNLVDRLVRRNQIMSMPIPIGYPWNSHLYRQSLLIEEGFLDESNR